MPQPCSSLRLVLTLERATSSVSTMSSALRGSGRDIEQGVHLGDGAVDAPARAHLAPVEDELLLDRRRAG